MAELNQESVVDYLSKLTVMEIAQLTKTLEQKWGVSAAPIAAVGAVAAPAAEEAKKEEQTEFTVELASSGEKKIEVVKAIRALTQVSLKEAKDLADNAPSVIKQGVSKADAEAAKKALEDAGGKVTVK
ncbi:MAG: 50S ribosomal protein L7/L12 [Deltaproteobacteria bacterium]|nr:50S ribosomal protein L7/L12 [Deltaproteobacteria bacterium]